MSSERTLATTRDETPAFFSANGEVLFGILTSPSTEPRGEAVILLSGAGFPISINVNRLSVRLARRLAAQGFHVLRFDYHGGGESTGAVTGVELERPFVDDLDGAVRWLRGHGLEVSWLVGSCFGARTALACADRNPNLRGVALISMPVSSFDRRGLARMAKDLSYWNVLRRALSIRVLLSIARADRRRIYMDFLRAKLRSRLRRRSSRAYPEVVGPAISPTPLGQLKRLTGRGVAVLLVYGEEDSYFRDFQAAKEEQLGHVLDEAGSLVELATLPGWVHGFPDLNVQKSVISLAEDWIQRRAMHAPREAQVEDGDGVPLDG